jgi:hypothetical protein
MVEPAKEAEPVCVYVCVYVCVCVYVEEHLRQREL